MKYEIYQIKEDFNIRKYGFRSYDDIMKSDGFDKNRYYKVYEGDYELSGAKKDMPPAYLLGEIFTKFNIDRPLDFRGHSLSISDVVIIDGIAFYCDRFGWQIVNF